MEIISLLQSVIPSIAPLLVFVACLYYLIRLKAIDAMLLTVGSGIGLAMSAYFTYMPYFAQTRALTANTMSTYYVAGGVVSLIGTVIFTVGLFIMIDKVLKLIANQDIKEKGRF